MNRPALLVSLTALSTLAVLAGCASTPSDHAVAEVRLAPTQGNTATGLVTFTQHNGVIEVDAQVRGLSPGGHGFHIHEKGDCSAPDATSAGGHFNPGGHPHGHPDKDARHAGDLPMLVADAQGNASLKATLKGISLSAGSHAIVGRGLIVHAAPDDYTTQPTGNAGGRVACAVITLR